MKNKPKSRIKTFFSKIFKVRFWTDYDRNKGFVDYLRNVVEKLIRPNESDEVETYAQAVARLNLSDEALLVQQKSLFRLSIFMVCLGLGFFGYALFELFMGTWLAMLITLIVVAFAFALAFRYHFLYFQMKEKKLGCTLSEWLHQGLLKEKP